MNEFRNQVTIMTNLKMYIERICKERDRIDCAITHYVKQATDNDTLVLKD